MRRTRILVAATTAVTAAAVALLGGVLREAGPAAGGAAHGALGDPAFVNQLIDDGRHGAALQARLARQVRT